MDSQTSLDSIEIKAMDDFGKEDYRHQHIVQTIRVLEMHSVSSKYAETLLNDLTKIRIKTKKKCQSIISKEKQEMKYDFILPALFSLFVLAKFSIQNENTIINVFKYFTLVPEICILYMYTQVTIMRLESLKKCRLTLEYIDKSEKTHR